MKLKRLVMKLQCKKVLLASCVASIGFTSAPAFAADNVVIQWNNALLQAIRVTRPGPTIVARALFVGHTCMYEAWAAFDYSARGTETRKTLRQPVSYRTLSNKNQAISYAAYRAAVDLFPTQAPAFNALMSSLGYDPAYVTNSVYLSRDQAERNQERLLRQINLVGLNHARWRR